MLNQHPQLYYLPQQAPFYGATPAYSLFEDLQDPGAKSKQELLVDIHGLATSAVAAQHISPPVAAEVLRLNYKPNQVIAQFPSKEDLKNFIKLLLSNMERCNIVINSLKLYAIYFTCDKFGNYRTTVKGDRKRNGFSKRVKCPYRLVANFKHDLWVLKMVDGEHNHGTLDRSKNSKRGVRSKEPVQEAKVSHKASVEPPAVNYGLTNVFTQAGDSISTLLSAAREDRAHENRQPEYIDTELTRR